MHSRLNCINLQIQLLLLPYIASARGGVLHLLSLAAGARWCVFHLLSLVAGTASREKPKPQPGNADKFNNWRKRVNEENQAQSGWEDRRNFREGRDNRSGYSNYNKNRYASGKYSCTLRENKMCKQ